MITIELYNMWFLWLFAYVGIVSYVWFFIWYRFIKPALKKIRRCIGLIILKLEK